MDFPEDFTPTVFCLKLWSSLQCSQCCGDAGRLVFRCCGLFSVSFPNVVGTLVDLCFTRAAFGTFLSDSTKTSRGVHYSSSLSMHLLTARAHMLQDFACGNATQNLTLFQFLVALCAFYENILKIFFDKIVRCYDHAPRWILEEHFLENRHVRPVNEK